MAEALFDFEFIALSKKPGSRSGKDELPIKQFFDPPSGVSPSSPPLTGTAYERSMPNLFVGEASSCGVPPSLLNPLKREYDEGVFGLRGDVGRVCDLVRSILLIISRTFPGGRNLSLSGEDFPLLEGEPLAFRREVASSCACEGASVVVSSGVVVSGGVGVGGRMLGDSSSSNSRQSSVFGGVLWAMNCAHE